MKDGKINNNRFSKYIIPTAMDVPVTSSSLKTLRTQRPMAQRVEPVMVPVAPAILNAIHNAVGVRIMALPATP